MAGTLSDGDAARGRDPRAALRRAWDSWFSSSMAASEAAPWWAHAVVTLVFSLSFAALLTAVTWVLSGGRVDPLRALGPNAVIALCIGYAIHALFALSGAVLGAARIDAWSPSRRALFFSLLPLLGVALGFGAAHLLLGPLGVRDGFAWASGRFVGGALLIWALFSLIWWRVSAHQMRLAEAQRQREAERVRAERAERAALLAQLRGLQAQIEPHFLFNTLANVVGLIEPQPQQAKAMLERLIDLLRGSLSASRAAQTTLGQEIEQLRAYLDIMSLRMVGRMRYEIRVQPPLRQCPVPPLLLQPLVENAILHGLEPKVGGGRLLVAATAREARLEICVEDDGVGFDAARARQGVGLANLRERLATLYGSAAGLTIEDARPGTRVRLWLPLPPEERERAESSRCPLR
jgi:hypothetical protein